LELKVHINLGRWTKTELDKIIRDASLIRDTGLRIAFLSNLFIELQYRESTLTGDGNTAEVFAINLSGVDCFTLLDYVEAMRLSESFDDFVKNLQQVRYRNNMVTYENRKHFFTDWSAYMPASVEDLTEQIGRGRVKRVLKTLNLKEDGTALLNGIGSCQRNISYIPPENIDSTLINRLKTGDYAGVYSDTQGLDVSHVGIIIKDGDTISLRHASSDKRYRKVLDQDFQEYISGKPGLIILRPRD
jgi:hypothetical protein